MDTQYLENLITQAVRNFGWSNWYYNKAGQVEIRCYSNNVILRGSLQSIYEGLCKLPYDAEIVEA